MRLWRRNRRGFAYTCRLEPWLDELTGRSIYDDRALDDDWKPGRASAAGGMAVDRLIEVLERSGLAKFAEQMDAADAATDSVKRQIGANDMSEKDLLYADVFVVNVSGTFVRPGIVMGFNDGDGTWDVNVFARSESDVSEISEYLTTGAAVATSHGLIVRLHRVKETFIELRDSRLELTAA